MKVLDLQCPHGHRFEGWFASDHDFESQLSRHLIACPICAATEVSRMPSAPRLNLSGATKARQDSAQPPDAQSATPPETQATDPVETKPARKRSNKAR